MENEFNAIRRQGWKQGDMKVQQYLDVLTVGMKKGIIGEEYIKYVCHIFTLFSSDLNRGQITDAVCADDDTASLRVFIKEMQRLRRENGTPENHYLFRK